MRHERGVGTKVLFGLQAAGAVLALAAIPVFHADGERQEAAAAAYDRALADACGADPRYNTLAHDSDTQPLPALEQKDYTYNEDGIASIGSIVISPNTISWSTGKSPVPNEYAEGFDEAFKSPYVACTAREGYSEIALSVYKDGTEKPGYMPENGLNVLEPRVVFGMGAGAHNEHKTINQRGDIRTIVTHETTHAVVDAWMKSENPQTQTLLAELETLYQQEYRAVNEQYRIEYGAETITALEQTRQSFAAIGEHDIAKGISSLIDRYQQPGGLDEVGFHRDDYPGHKQIAAPDMQLINAVRENGHDISELNYEGVDLQPLYEAVATYTTYVQESSSYLNEGAVIPFAGKNGGHSHKSLNEKVASAVTSTQIMPMEVIKRIQQLEPARQMNVKRQFALIAELYKQENPKLPQFMLLDEVAKLL